MISPQLRNNYSKILSTNVINKKMFHFNHSHCKVLYSFITCLNFVNFSFVNSTTKKQLKYTANIKISTDLLKLFQNNGYISSNISFVCGMWWINQLYAIGLFLYHLKTENVSFSDVSRRYRKRLDVRNGLEDSITEYNQTKLASQLLPSMPLGYFPVNDKGAYLVKQF